MAELFLVLLHTHVQCLQIVIPCHTHVVVLSRTMSGTPSRCATPIQSAGLGVPQERRDNPYEVMLSLDLAIPTAFIPLTCLLSMN